MRHLFSARGVIPRSQSFYFRIGTDRQLYKHFASVYHRPHTSQCRFVVTTAKENSTTIKPFSEMKGPPDWVMVNRFNRFFYFMYTAIRHKMRLNPPDPTQFHIAGKADYGDIYKMKVDLDGTGLKNFVVVSHPDFAEKVLKAPEKTFRRVQIDLNRIYAERNQIPEDIRPLSLLRGDKWAARRKPTQEKMLRPAVVATYVPLIEKITNEFVEMLRKRKQTDDLLKDLANYATESVGMLCFNKRLGCLESEHNIMIETVQRIIDMIGLSITSPDKSFLTTRTKFYNEFEELVLKFREFEMKEINSQKDYLNKLENEGKLEEYLEKEPNFMHSLLSDPRMSEEVVSVTIMDLFAAGIDTTSSSMVWVLIDLCLHPDKQEKLYQEIQEVVGDDKCLTKEHIARLSYMKACVKESFRTHFPILGGTGRYLETDMVIGGYQVPKDTLVMTNGPSMCIDERFFPDPKKYLPERWLRDADAQISSGRQYPFAMSVFGFGPRSCIGQRFAENEIFIGITKLIQNFQVSLPEGVTEVDYKFTLFRKPVDKVTMIFKERQC